MNMKKAIAFIAFLLLTGSMKAQQSNPLLKGLGSYVKGMTSESLLKDMKDSLKVLSDDDLKARRNPSYQYLI